MQNNIENIYFHASQFPEQLTREYEESFIQRRINHKFHYHTTHQSQQWLNLHKIYSPAQESQGYHQAYQQCFYAALNTLNDRTFDLISLGCGGGEKEVLLRSLLDQTQPAQQSLIKQPTMTSYYPVDVSPALAITAAREMRQQYPELPIQPIVCDLLHTGDLLSYIPNSDGARLITFFCMIPNLTPATILPILNQFLSPGDLLLFSANLAPGKDYDLGIQTVLPQYDNASTKEWLMSVLRDVGIHANDGDITVSVDTHDTQTPAETALKKISTYFTVRRAVSLTINNKTIHWQPGERVQLFFSYRYTTPLVKHYLQQYGMQVLHSWEFNNQEEGLYLCQRAA
jgi:uncharacterized SAM-dependent methyltransferase